MIEYAISSLLSIMNSFSVKRLTGAINSKRWRSLFSVSGEALIQYLEDEKAFVEDLRLVFSKKNMKALADRLENEPGTSFPDLLHDELVTLFQKYEVDDTTIETCVFHFSTEIFQFIRENDTDKALGKYLIEWERKQASQLGRIERITSETNKLVKQSTDVSDLVFSIQDIDEKLNTDSPYEFDLSFFDLDDDSFKERFEMAVNQQKTIIQVEGKSKEESLYRILNEIKQMYPMKKTWIIKDKKAWKSLEGTSDQILIPFFYFNDISALPNNVNIFIYNEDGTCNSRDKLVLRRRTKINLYHSLVKIGVDPRLAQQWIEKTHGIYASLKTKIFNIPAPPQRPIWAENTSEEVLAALLIGSWTENESDKEIFETFSGKTYYQCMKVLKQYIRIEEPLIIASENHHVQFYQIACIEEAWITLEPLIDSALISVYLDTVVSVMSNPDPVFHDFSEYYADKERGLNSPRWSKVIKQGLVRSLILLACINENSEREFYVNNAVKKILDSLSGKDDWLYISNYITDLCEAAPRIVLEKIESELDPEKTTGMLELFEGSDYQNILWAVELLLQQKEYLPRTIQWLWMINEKNIENKSSSSLKDILKIIFCAWYNMTPLTAEQKILEAETAMKKYQGAWEVISSLLPKSNNIIFATLYRTRFRDIYEPENIYAENANNVFIAYLDLCIESAKLDPDKWCTLLDELTRFEEKIQKEKLDLLVQLSQKMSDWDKTSIKEKLREIIYHHRRFADSDWAMDEACVCLFENAYNNISVDDIVFDFLYVFTPSHSFPLLHPALYTPDERSHSDRDLEEEQIDKERVLAVNNFSDNNLPVAHLIELAANRKKESNLGFVLAHYFDHDSFNEATFESLVKYASSFPYQIYHYVRNVMLNGQTNFPDVYEKLKSLTTDPSLIAYILSLQCVSSVEDCLLFQETETVKKAFWTEGHSIVFSENPSTRIIKKALDECILYGNLSTYIEFLFDVKDILSPEDLYQYFLKAENVQIDEKKQVSEWYIEQIFDLMHQLYLNDNEKSYHLARMEWFFGGVLHWDQMKCMRNYMETDPRFYAFLIDIMYRKDHEVDPNPAKQKYANKMYSLFRDIHFCPAEKNGTVQYEDLINWVEKFRKILEQQDQSSLWDTILGNLFPFSPVDEDGYMPCKAIRQFIEENHTENMESAYVTTEFNKRGIYSPDGGRSEMAIAHRYKHNADMIRTPYNYTARIYDDLSRQYLEMAAEERKRAENDL